MPEIPLTTVTTPLTRGSLDLCKGVPLYPIGSLQAGVSGENVTGTIVDSRVTVGLGAATARVRMGFGFYCGICGPAYATNLSLQGTTSGSTMNLATPTSDTVAGLEIGFGLTLDFVIDIAGWLAPDMSYQGRSTIDLVQKLLDGLLGRVSGGSYQKGELQMPSGASFAAREVDLGGLARTGTSSLRPEFFMILNVVNLFPSLKAANVALKEFGGSLEVGPTINLVMPVEIAVTGIRTDGLHHVVTGNVGNRLVGIESHPANVPAGTMEVVLTHRSSVEFGMGLGCNISVLKVFSLGGHTKPVDVFRLLNRPVILDPIETTLRAHYTPAGPIADSPAGGGEEGFTPYHVVFEDATAFVPD